MVDTFCSHYQYLYMDHGKALPALWASPQGLERLCHSHRSEAVGSLVWPMAVSVSTAHTLQHLAHARLFLLPTNRHGIMLGGEVDERHRTVGGCETSLLGTEMLLAVEGGCSSALEKLIPGWSI